MFAWIHRYYSVVLLLCACKLVFFWEKWFSVSIGKTLKSKNTLCSWVIKLVFDCAWENLDVSFLHICYKYYFISVIKINFTCKAKHNLQTSSRSLLTCIINVLQKSFTHSITFRNNYVSNWANSFYKILSFGLNSILS